MYFFRKQIYFNSRRLLYVAFLFLLFIINPFTVYPAYTQINLAGSVLVVEKQGSGNGSITSIPDGINCGSVCTAQFATGSQVILRVVPAQHSVFLGWIGDCAGQGLTCTFTLEQSSVMVAIFGATYYAYLPNIRHDADIVINEFMSSNSNTLADEDGDYSDWVELYNHGATTVSLYGCGLSDNDNPFRWTFPDIKLDPGQYLLVWASGKNRTLPGAPLHTNFSISVAGERLRLTHPELGTLGTIGPVAVPPDMSYGVQPDGGAMRYFFDHPTPGASNTSIGYTEILSPPVFSQSGGFYTKEFNLTLTPSDPDVTILYTLDGSIPDLDNLNGVTYFYKNQYPQNPGDPFGAMLNNTYRSYLYSQPIRIVGRANEPDKLTHISTTIDKDPSYYFPANPIFKGTVVRARAIKKDAFPSAVQTHTFFVTPEANNRYKFPVVSLSMQEDTLFDYNIGIYVAGTVFDEWRIANPDAIANPCTPGNYVRSTQAWEYPTYMELFEVSSTQAALRQDLGFRIQGVCSRSWPRKSLKLYARSEYGSSYLNYPIFPNLPYNSYKRLALRNSGQDEGVTNFRDVLIQAVVSHLRVNTQVSRPAILFINGEYWGIHDMMERYDKYYLNRVYGVDPENIDYLKDNLEVEEGDAQHYTETLDYIRANGLNEPEHYQYIQTRMDVENFMDFQIANIYAANTDWPGKNVDFWRLRTPQYNPQSPYGHDGRWRWLLFDTDFGFGLEGTFTHNTLELATMAGGSEWPNPDWSTFLLRSLLENDSFRTDFINRFADLLNTAFLPERVTGLIAEKKKILEPEMPEHIARWNRPTNMDVWNDNINVMVDFANQRSAYQRMHIQQKFGLESGVNITLNVSDPKQGYVRINTIDITADTPGVSAMPYPWTGTYFKNIPVQVTAIPRSGYKFTGWVEYPHQTSATMSVLPVDAITLTAQFEPLADLPNMIYSVLPGHDENEVSYWR